MNVIFAILLLANSSFAFLATDQKTWIKNHEDRKFKNSVFYKGKFVIRERNKNITSENSFEDSCNVHFILDGVKTNKISLSVVANCPSLSRYSGFSAEIKDQNLIGKHKEILGTFDGSSLILTQKEQEKMISRNFNPSEQITCDGIYEKRAGFEGHRTTSWKIQIKDSKIVSIEAQSEGEFETQFYNAGKSCSKTSPDQFLIASFNSSAEIKDIQEISREEYLRDSYNWMRSAGCVPVSAEPTSLCVIP